ncbi:hypothetical protein SDC9_154110 [bioreactor metagenome]|uniref:Uncharacterized protein n=1 Tax=bioreactor metagenome TaxID=1076179 RepID=A0A645F2I0_9ZZZZ
MKVEKAEHRYETHLETQIQKVEWVENENTEGSGSQCIIGNPSFVEYITQTDDGKHDGGPYDGRKHPGKENIFPEYKDDEPLADNKRFSRFTQEREQHVDDCINNNYMQSAH